jgi:thiamine kinase-like enzyme
MTDPVPAETNDLIHALPLWRGPIAIAPLPGGMTNRNFVVTEAGRRFVVRLGGDIPVHGVMRFNEHAASRAAGAAGISPAVRHAGPGVLVIDHIDGHTLTQADVRADLPRCTALLRRAHREITAHLRGPILAFNVFHILRDYLHRLRDEHSPHTPRLAPLAAAAEALERQAGADPLVCAHNDLLSGNLIDDGTRLWLIDWDYAGFNTPLFDLGGLASNNAFSPEEETAMLEAYFDAAPDAALLRRTRAITCAALLRETLWSMVSETHSALDFDYASYTAENLACFEAAYARFST